MPVEDGTTASSEEPEHEHEAVIEPRVLIFYDYA